MSTTLKKSFPTGTLVKWSASAENFHTSSGGMILNDDTTLNITLKDSKIAFEWDGGGTKTVRFGDKEVTSTSPICVGNDGPMTGFSNAGFSNDPTTKNVFIDAKGLPSNVVLSNLFNNDTNVIENIEIINSSHITDFTSVFYKMLHIKTVSVDTSGATTLEELFSHSLIENAPFLETSNVINTSYMFNNCYSLKYIPPYDLSNVIDMGWMFQGCEKLTTLPQLDTSNVTNISMCFGWCTSLKNVGGFIGLKTNVDFGQCPLTHESALNIIDNLAVSSGQYIQFKSSTFKTLTPAEIAKATDKGWKVWSA